MTNDNPTDDNAVMNASQGAENTEEVPVRWVAPADAETLLDGVRELTQARAAGVGTSVAGADGTPIVVLVDEAAQVFDDAAAAGRTSASELTQRIIAAARVSRVTLDESCPACGESPR